MGRLTEKDASGRWQVKGLPWEKLQAGETLTEEPSLSFVKLFGAVFVSLFGCALRFR